MGNDHSSPNHNTSSRIPESLTSATTDSNFLGCYLEKHGRGLSSRDAIPEDGRGRDRGIHAEALQDKRVGWEIVYMGRSGLAGTRTAVLPTNLFSQAGNIITMCCWVVFVKEENNDHTVFILSIMEFHISGYSIFKKILNSSSEGL